MRSSTIAAIITAALVSSHAVLTMPALQFDERPANSIWETDIVTPLRARLRNEVGALCLPKYDAATCSTELGAEVTRASATTRSEFERCANGSWFKWRCILNARTDLQAVTAPTIMATIETTVAERRAVADTQRQVVEQKRKADAELEQRQKAEVMGSDDGRSYLLAAYHRRIAAAERECRDRPNLLRVVQWHHQANPEDYRVINSLRTICYAAVRKLPFVIQPDGRQTVIGYPIPPFTQIDYWGRSRCSERGRDAWLCVKQSADALMSKPAYWGELDHETNAILFILSLPAPELKGGIRRP